jgi:hypothetical protein
LNEIVVLQLPRVRDRTNLSVWNFNVEMDLGPMTAP